MIKERLQQAQENLEEVWLYVGNTSLYGYVKQITDDAVVFKVDGTNNVYIDYVIRMNEIRAVGSRCNDSEHQFGPAQLQRLFEMPAYEKPE